MPPPESPSSRRQLLVEGRDYLNFFGALVERLDLTGGVHIQDFGGVSELRDFLQALTRESGFRETVHSLGIVRDAERNAAGAFQSVQGSLQAAGLPAPDTPGQRADGEPAVTVLILPGDDRSGMLETLLCETFASSPESDCIEAFFECVEGASDSTIRRPDKARAHAWLATRPDPHVSVGFAAQKGYWDLEHSALDSVREFLTAL